MSVAISEHYGIIIRKDALQRCGVASDDLKSLMETEEWMDEDENLISAGPHFGQEASNEFTRRLEGLGLIYGEDFFDFEDMLPAWCKMHVHFVES
jgi:hypothetical protein